MNSSRNSTLALLAFFAALPLAAQTPLNFSVYAGSPASAGPDDGGAAGARFAFDFTSFIVVDGSGASYLTDPANQTIRRIGPGGLVTTFAGLEGVSGSTDGKGGLARFKSPSGLALDGSGNLYVADSGNGTIRKITSAGVVTTLAGTPGVFGSVDATGPAAKFGGVYGIEVDAGGNVYAADGTNNTIRKITSAGVVTTIAGQSGVCDWVDATGTAAAFCFPSGVAIDPSTGDLFVADDGNAVIRKITSAGVVSTIAGQVGICGNSDGFGGAASFCSPWSIARDAAGNLYVTDESNRNVRAITPGGAVSTLAGPNAALCSPFCPFGSANGTGTAARFGAPEDVAINLYTGGLYMTDIFNHDVRAISLPGAVVSRVAGTPGTVGYADGTGTAAQFNFRAGNISRDATFIYVADTSSNTVRKIAAGAVVTTLAGSAGQAGFTEGTGTAARFNTPRGVAADGFGNVFVADTANHKIRLVNSGGTASTWAGPDAATCTGNGNFCPGGIVDGAGTTARFRQPYAAAVDGSGNLYVVDRNNHNVRKIDTFRNVTTFAGPDGALCVISGTQCPSGSTDATGTAARFLNPQGIAVDSSGNVYVADTGNRTIRKITVGGVVTTVAGTAGQSGSADGTGAAARFTAPKNLSIDASGNLLIADSGNSTLRKMTPTGVVTTIAGYSGHVGSGPGTGLFTRFFYPSSVITDASGNYLVMDAGNDALLISAPTGLVDLATIDQQIASTGVARQLNTNPNNATSWLWKLIRQPTGSASALSSAVIRNPTFTPDVQDVYTYRVTATNGANSATTEVSLRTALKPRMTESMISRPLHAMGNDVVLFGGEELVSPFQLYFSDGANPTVPATVQVLDPSRGMLMARVPAGAVSGYMKLTTGGVDAPLYYFRRDAGTSVTGTNQVSGQITRASDSAPVVGAGVILFYQFPVVGCGNSGNNGTIWDFTVTDASGNYTLHGQSASYTVMIFAPLSYGLANSGANVTLSGTPQVANIALVAGTTVTAHVVDAASLSPLANVRVNFDKGPAFEGLLTDASGNISTHVAPASWQLGFNPSPGTANANLQVDAAIGVTSPQDLGTIALAGGVKITGVLTRSSDGTPISGADMQAQPQMGGYSNVDQSSSQGDGSYTLVVPPNQTYNISTQYDTTSGLFNNSAGVAVVTSPVIQNFVAPDSAFVTGTVTDKATDLPIGGLSVKAVRTSDMMGISYTNTCADGTYSLNIPAGAAYNQFVTTENSGCTSQCNPPPPPLKYANQTWNNTAGGTYFPCEGVAISQTTPGSSRTGINFSVPQSATVSGSFLTQASSCTTTDAGVNSFGVALDDGAAHACGLGDSYSNGSPPPPGTYSISNVPPSNLLASMRVCHNNPGNYAPQCWNLKRTDQAYTPIIVASGATATANFCLGNQPTTQVANFLITKAGGSNLNFTWNASTDLYQTVYDLRGSNTAIPVPPPGTWPANPNFSLLGTFNASPANNVFVPGGSYFFLIAAAGPTGNEGPVGSYGN